MSDVLNNRSMLDTAAVRARSVPRRNDGLAHGSGRTMPSSGVSIRDAFGEDVFSEKVMRERLSADVFRAMQDTMHRGAPLRNDVVKAVAEALREWALERGATHYAHRIQPLNGMVAEKHDALLIPDGRGGEIVSFSDGDLVQGEPDASSFPSGGLRATNAARGYSIWDPTSPAFLIRYEDSVTLCIPAVFISWSGESLDKKTPLLRSIDALSKQALRVLRLFGNDIGVSRVITTVGPEQEYFLVDESLYAGRPDLSTCNRTLVGAAPARHQQLADHYFGIIPQRVRAFMSEVETALSRLGVPVKTRHNEVAPNQFEIAPLFEEANVACDHQLLIMETLTRVARHHGMRALLHEKPFAGINGSGKHNNWSMSTDTGVNLLDPKRDTHSNWQFLVFLCAVIAAVDKRAALLRASVASTGNDHRLGGHEAPPAIMSIFLGDMLSDIITQLEQGAPTRTLAREIIDVGVATLPQSMRHAGDRNRTSPFAFTGNKFEFRAVGSLMSCAWPNTVIDTMVAESIDEIVDAIELALGGDRSREAVETATRTVLQDVIRRHKRVIFDGDNYSADWQAESARRGLPNVRSSADALAAFATDDAAEFFAAYDVLSAEELAARAAILSEKYAGEIRIEATAMIGLARNTITPACIAYQGRLAAAVGATKSAGASATRQDKLLHDLDVLINEFIQSTDRLQALVDLPADDDALENAQFAAKRLKPAMAELREFSDRLERVVDADAWPLPTYRELLAAL